MSLNIPMPVSGMAAFNKSLGFDNLMKQILDRNQLKQKTEHEKDAMAQLERHFQANLGLSKAAAGRAALAASDAHKLALMNMNPNKEVDQIQRLYELYNNPKYGNQDTTTQHPAPQNNELLHQKLQAMGMFGQQPEMPQGKGAMPMQEQAQEETPQYPVEEPMTNTAPANQGAVKPNLMQQIVAGALKKHGYNVSAQTPQEKADNQYNAFVKKEEYKAAHQTEAQKDLSDLRARTKAGLKAGEKEFFDDKTGLPLGKEIPLTQAERESERGNIQFNEMYPYVYKGGAPFSGQGSIKRLEQAAANYKTDPKAKKLFDDLVLADKILAATTVNEATTLKSGHQVQTFNNLKKSLEAQDVPETIKRLIKEYQLPSSLQLHAAMRYQKIISVARKKAIKNTPATQRLFYNPEMEAQHEQEANSLASPQANNDVSEVIVIDPQGKRFKTTEVNAAHLPKGWSRG
jgi:hypothetical protein